MKSVSRNKLNVLFSKKSDKIDNVSVFRRLASTTIADSRKPLPPQDLTPLHVAGDGDRVRCCRLCGGNSDLKYFMDTCEWEGVEEQYGQLVYDCFGVKVTPSDSMVCEWCVRALRTTQKLRALVRAAFSENSRSDKGVMAGTKSNSTVLSCKTSTSLKQSKKLVNQPQLRKKSSSRRPLGTPLPSRRREPTKKWINDVKNDNKRTIVNCERCRQKYPMLISNGEPLKTFLCARCKKDGDTRTAVCKQCGVMVALKLLRAHTEMHLRDKARAKARNRQLKKQLTPTPISQLEMSREKKYKCSKCPKKFNVAANLATHMQNAHEECRSYSSDIKQNEDEMTSEISTHHPHITSITPLESTEFQLLFKNQRAQNLSINPQNA